MAAIAIVSAALLAGALLWVSLRLRAAFGRGHMKRIARLDPSRCADRDRIVVCFGDSITQGSVSFDWVAELRRRLEPEGYTVLNAGINGELAYNLLARVDAVVRVDPAYVVLLVGTNDARATEDEGAAALYRRQMRLPQQPDEAFFRDHYRLLLTALEGRTRAKLLLVTLPMLGERDGDPVDAVVRRFNAFIEAEAAARGHHSVSLYRALADDLAGSARSSPPAYSASASLRLTMKAALQRHLLGWEWDRIAERNGMTMLTDMIHLSERGGRKVAELVEAALRVGEAGPEGAP